MMLIAVLFAVFNMALCNPINSSYLSPVQSSASASESIPARAPFNSASNGSSTRKPISILKFSQENDGDGTYSYNYEGANGINAEETGDARGDGTKVHGSFSFTLPNGEHVSVTYTADENGYIAEGSHIPAIPEAIQKALEQNAAAEARGIFDDGQYHGEGLEESQYKEELYAPLNVVSAKSGIQTAATGGYKY